MKLHILNRSGKLDANLDNIRSAFSQAEKIADEKLGVKTVDVIFRAQPDLAIPELGIGGYTETDGTVIYVSIDSSKQINSEEYLTTLLHELHHAARFQKIGYTHNLAAALAQEGLASLFEEEISGKQPIYANQKLDPADIAKAIQELKNDGDYNHSRWFFGTKDIQRWFGYTYGYTLCKQYAADNNTDSTQLVSTDYSILIKP